MRKCLEISKSIYKVSTTKRHFAAGSWSWPRLVMRGGNCAGNVRPNCASKSLWSFSGIV